MKHFVMLPAVLSVVTADLSDGACGPKPPTVPEFDKDMVSDQLNAVTCYLVKMMRESHVRESRNLWTKLKDMFDIFTVPG